MKYVAISHNVDNVVIIYVYNTISKSVHSTWDTMQQAQDVATDLNKLYRKDLSKKAE